jgi:hypothetical protein
MKTSTTLLLIAALVAIATGSAGADNGLFPVPAGPPPPPSRAGGLFPTPGGDADGLGPVPDCSDVRACVDFFHRWITAERERVMAGLAEQLSSNSGARCIHSPLAYGFQNEPGPNNRGSSDFWRVNCLAQQNGHLSHIINFEMNMIMLPSDCASDQTLMNYANNPTSHIRGQAATFFENLKSTCHFAARAVRNPNPVAVDANWAKANLFPSNPDLGQIIDPSDLSVLGSSSEGGGRPLPDGSRTRLLKNPLAPPPPPEGDEDDFGPATSNDPGKKIFNSRAPASDRKQ